MAEQLKTIHFESPALPYYVILQKQRGQTNVLGFYNQGAINNLGDFGDFLKNALKRNGERVAELR